MFCPAVQYVHCRAQVTPGSIYIIQYIIYRLARDRLSLASKEIDYSQTKALKQMIILKGPKCEISISWILMIFLS
jgi:hypothetical protein